ncbi:MAG: ATP-binding protein [Thiocapsa sp.]|uniref:ATP-binding protein n=1 Tax=Thiocapsa sp. TaxID=2024551 RepID=UPI001BCF6F70|nr:ATP-binding protein [Thiocapsa sp.]QVL47492.1 MAG: ATP-binding protein [Thiocapsa sp.]
MNSRNRDDAAGGAFAAAVSDGPGRRKPVKADTRVFDSRLEAAHEAASGVRAFCDVLGWSEVELSQIELCVYEAFVNAVEHAYRNEPGHEVRVTAEVDAGFLRVRVCQHGVPLDAARVAATPAGFDDLPSGLDAFDCEPRGRGIRIIKSIMSHCEVESDGDSACLLMAKPLAAQRP